MAKSKELTEDELALFKAVKKSQSFSLQALQTDF